MLDSAGSDQPVLVVVRDVADEAKLRESLDNEAPAHGKSMEEDIRKQLGRNLNRKELLEFIIGLGRVRQEMEELKSLIQKVLR